MELAFMDFNSRNSFDCAQTAVCPIAVSSVLSSVLPSPFFTTVTLHPQLVPFNTYLGCCGICGFSVK